LEVSAPQLQWIRPPRQARTQKALVRLLDAAQELLEEKGFDDVSVAEVATRAGTSVGALYRRFKDKDGLLHALHERYCEEAFATADAALAPARWEGAGIPEILSESISFLIQVHREHLLLDRAVYQRAFSDARFSERASRLFRHVVSGLSDLLLARSEEIGHPQPRVGVDVGLRLVLAFLTQHYTMAGGDLDPLSDRQVTAELTRSCLAYLGVREPSFGA
jgi:AcrR family transcriptional regulator